MVTPSNNNNNNSNNYNINNTDPAGQKPEKGFYDYVAHPIESFYSFYAYLYPPETKDVNPTNFSSLEEKEIVYPQDNPTIPGKEALNIMQGIERKDIERKDDDSEVFSLESSDDDEFYSLEEDPDFFNIRSKESDSEVSGGDSGSDQLKIDKRVLELENILTGLKSENSELKSANSKLTEKESMLMNQVLDLNATLREIVRAPNSKESPTTESSSTESVPKEKPKAGEEKIVLSDRLKEVLTELVPNINSIDALFNKPIPGATVRTGKTVGQAGRGGRGGPAKTVGTRNDDSALQQKLGISQEELQENRKALPIIHKKLLDLLAQEPEITAILKENKDLISRASNFVSNAEENKQKLEFIQAELKKAKAEYDSFSQMINNYETLKKSAPEIAKNLEIEFTHKSSGETQILSYEEILEKGLIQSFQDDAVDAEKSLRNFKTIMDNLEKEYNGKLRYMGEGMREKTTPVADVVNLNFLIKEIKDPQKPLLDKLVENMRIYGVKVAQAKETVKLTPEDKELEAKRAEEMQLELQKKVKGIKPSNVTDYTFKQVEKK